VYLDSAGCLRDDLTRILRLRFIAEKPFDLVVIGIQGHVDDNLTGERLRRTRIGDDQDLLIV
jgi:hypothetical protein